MSVQINVAANQAALTASIQAGVQAYNQRFAQNNQLNLTINPRAFSQPLGRITGDVKDFEAALAASNARVIAFGASTAVLGGVIRSFKELANVTIEVEKNLADINRVFGLTTSQLQKFSTDLFNVTKQTASSFNDASQAALEFSRQGLKAEETLQRTKDALTLTRLAGVSTANAVDALTSTVNGFAATGVTTTQILNKLVAVEQDFAVGAGDLAEALSRTGQAAQEAGVSLDQLNALVTSAQQSTARGGAVIGNALKTIFTRLQRTDTLDQLEAFNISVRDVQGNILPAVTILQNFAGAYQNLADAQRAQLSEQVAGVYQVNILKAIVNDLNKSQGVYAGALQRGAMATNEAEVATAKLNQTLDALLKQTATSTQQLANNIGKVTFEPLARYGTEQLKSLVESMNEILEGEGIGSTFANGLLKGIRNILAGPGAIAAFFTLFKLIQNSFTYLSQALPQIAGITTETQNRKNIESAILQIMSQQGVVAQALDGLTGNQAAQAQLLLQTARAQTAEYQKQAALAQQLAVQLSGQGVKVAGSRGLQVTRAGGYIPASTKMAEVVGAKAGGYSPGRVVSSPVGGVMNTAEDVKYVPGFAQPFINPPAGSKAGRAHRQNAINRTGVDPYMNDGFIPNFAVKQFINDKGEVITGKKPNKTRDSYTLRLANYNPKNLKADEDLDLKRNLVDSGYWNDSVRDPKTGKIIHYHGERNDIYDTLSGNLKVVKYLNKDEVDKATKIAWDGLISGNKAWISDPDITKLGMDQSSVEAAFDRTKAKLGLKLEDFQFKKQASENSSIAAGNEKYRSVKNKTVYKTSEEFEKSLKGDFSNFIGDFYEQLVLKNKNVSGDYQISAGNTDPADLVPKILGLTMYKGIEAKNTAARINDLIAKAIRINVPKMNQETWDKSNDVDFGTLPIYQTMGARATVSHNGFIPNFSPLIDDNARNKHDFPGGIPILPIPDKALQNIVDRQKKRQMTYLDFDRTLVRTMGDIAYSRVSPDQKKGVLQKMFLNKEARLNDIKNSKLTQFGELLRKKIQEGVINPSLLGLLTASDETPGMPEYISSIWGIPKRNQVYSAKPGTKEARLAALGVSASGFIPNFAIPVDSARIPWFKKYASSYKNIASDKDVFRQIDFPTYGKGLDHDYAKVGNADMVSFLYEDFVRSAINIALGSKQVVRSKEAGFKHTPTNAISNRDPIDLTQKISNAKLRMIEVKQSKNNQKQTISQISDAKLKGLFQENPELAKNVELMSIIFNDPRYVDPTGKNPLGVLSPFEQSIAPIVKNSYADVDPTMRGKLGLLTDGLMKRYQSKKNLFSNGFIPNFAYKQAVMGLEESMSGNKAIFDTKPFPHIRNSSQPTFSSAISDHGGLGNALSDSMRGQKAAGLMSKGFVPNFASRAMKKARKRIAKNKSSNQQSSSATPSGTGPTPSPATPTFSNDDIDRAISDFINSIQSAEEKLSFFESAFGRSKLIASETLKLENALKAGGVSGDRLSKAMTEARNQINQQQGKFAKGLSSASTAISLAGPMLAGFAEQALFGNRKRTEMTAFERQSQAAISTGISAVSTGAGIGAAFGPQGALIGAAAGAVVGLVSAIDAAKLSLSELAEIDQELLKKQQASSQAASGYIDNQKKLNDLIASGASSQDIENATRNLSLSFNEIKDVDLAQIFANTGGNVNKLQDELKKYNDELTKKGAGKSALGNLQEGAGFFATTFMGGKTTAELGVKEPSEVAAELFRSSSLFKDTGMISAMKAGTNKDLIASVNRLASNRVGGDVPGLNKNAAQIAIAQKNYAKKFTDELFPDLEANDPARYQQELQRSIDLLFGKSGEAIALGLEKMGKLEASNTAIQKARSAALQGFAEIFGRIERSIRISSLQVAMALEKDSQINRINSAINEFTSNFSESIESFVMNSLPEGPNKLGFAQFTAQRKYDDAIAKQQIAAENFRFSQQKERNDYQKTREENITKLFKDVSLQSEQSAKFFESDIYGKVKSGDLSDLSAEKVSTTLMQKLIDQARSLGLKASQETQSLQTTLKGKTVDLSNFDFSDKDKVSKLIETVGVVQNNIAATGGAGSDQTYLKDLVAKFQNSLGDLYNTQEFFTNKAKKQEYDAAIELARLEGDQFNQRMSNAEKLFQVNQILEKAQLEAAKTLSVERAKVDNANFMRMESMKNLSASIASNLEVSKTEGTRDINRLKRTLQDPAGVAGLGVSERSERQFKIQEKILNKERAIEDANINAEIQQRMLELAAERENTTALYNLSQVIEKFAAETLLKDLGGEQAFKEMQNNPYLGKNIAFERANLGADALPEQREFLDQAEKYTPEQLAKFEAYQRTKASIDASRSGNTPTATVDAFADRMSKANFNKMDRDEQMTFLAEERKEADKAGAVALSNTISRFQEQIKLRKEALDISRQDVNEQVELDKRIIRTNNSFAGRFKTSFNNLKYQGEEIFLKLGEDLPRMFADGLVNGIKAAIRESDNLGEALMGIAGNFLDAISTAMMQSAVYSMLGSMGFNMAGAAGSVPAAKQKGGFIRAQSGMYISGTGSGDKYPALLENGEYVLNRNAVMAMGGPAELDKLNFSMAPRFASGGSFATELNDIKSMEEGMTTFGLENSKVYNELRDAERAKQAEKRRKAAERRKMIAGIVGSVAGIAASFGIMKMMGPKVPTGSGAEGMTIVNGRAVMPRQKGGSIGNRLSDTIPAYAEGGLYSSPIVKKYGVGMQNGGMYGGSSNNSNTVTNTNATNSFNFNTTVNRDGTIQMGADSTSYKQQDVELSNNLNSQVYKTVLDVIKQQQRFGGTLAGTRRPI